MSPLNPAVYRKLIACVIGISVLLALKYLNLHFDFVIPGLDQLMTSIVLDAVTGLATTFGVYQLTNASPGASP